jgi:carboxymethylenebutenolidase
MSQASTPSTPFAIDQIGTGAVRFPSGAPIPTITDQAVDPYFRSRMPKEVQVEAIHFFPQIKGTYPGVIVLHERWGLNVQIKDLANRLACEGFGVIVPNLYGRQGGMVTANAEVADALMARVNEADLLQDVSSCCEFLNTRDHIKRNLFAVVGFGLGGSLAIRFAAQRKRLRGAVAYYGKPPAPLGLIKDIVCPVLYHRPEDDAWVTPEEIEQLRRSAKEFGKQVDIVSYPGLPHAFANETRPDSYRADAARAAWERTVAFLKDCFKDAK